MASFPHLDQSEFAAVLGRLRNRSAAVVYSFQPESRPEKVWYDQWQSSVISSYGLSLEALGVHPYYMDVTTFCRQALAGNLPDLICSFNLNAGIAPITHWALVPAVSVWCEVEPMPARAEVLIVGERKDTAALIAASAGLETPQCFQLDQLADLPDGFELVVKPRDLGGSEGVSKVTPNTVFSCEPTKLSPMIIQEFIPGYDLTVPVVYKPTLGRHRSPVGVLYLPKGKTGTTWIHDKASKTRGTGYRKVIVQLPPDLEESVVRFAQTAGLGPYARIDFRIATSEPDPSNPRFWRSRSVFLEVNPLPTLRRGINFLNAVASEQFRDAFMSEYEVIDETCGVDSPHAPHALLLACAMASIIEAS